MKQAENKRRLSLRSRLLGTLLVCWVVPILIVVTLAGVLLSSSYESSMRQELVSGAESAMRQLEIRVGTAFEASKAVSYDGIVRSAYRSYEQDGDGAALYSTVSDYLSQNFSRDKVLKAVFLSFPDVNMNPYTTSRGTETNYGILREYKENTEGLLLERMKDEESGIFLVELDGALYIVRNLLDAYFEPYAMVAMLCDVNDLFQSLEILRQVSNVSLVIDDSIIIRPGQGVQTLEAGAKLPTGEVKAAFSKSGHDFRLTASVPSINIWQETPSVRISVFAATLLVVPLLLLAILLFHSHVTHPVEALLEATRRVQNGERGYVIEEVPKNLEFQKLYNNFNAMSEELESQFERSYQEQQALQQAKIKALQSQINPHFLNNTLEIINWEARIADNKRVSAMIEALSVMLDAALDRNGRGLIPLREELSYIDAYLYIIKERLGERLEIVKSIDETILDQEIPRLILQPIVENAVEHDISARRGAKLYLRAYREGGSMILEAEHDGSLTAEDRESISRLLSSEPDASPKGQVGIRNVKERLRLLYGEAGRLSIEGTDHGTVLARVSFPAAL